MFQFGKITHSSLNIQYKCREQLKEFEGYSPPTFNVAICKQVLKIIAYFCAMDLYQVSSEYYLFD